tara:strand:- start:261 stop:575 length:315 start_codon:yes stop_codon:yes gene_type:complete
VQLKKVVLCIFFMMGSFSISLHAQSAEKEKTTNLKKPINKDLIKEVIPQKTTLDTEDSFKFLGNQLLFQVKKRLNLTSEEEEKSQSKSSANKKFSFFGIEVERE